MTADSAPVPLYETVKRHITGAISSGVYAPGARLPSESELVALLSVSRMTVNRALRELSRDGVVTRVQGVGSFVAQPGAGASILEIRDIRETIAARGGRHSCRTIEAGMATAEGETAALLEVTPGSEVCHVVLVHAEDGRPLQLERRFRPPRLRARPRVGRFRDHLGLRLSPGDRPGQRTGTCRRGGAADGGGGRLAGA